MSRARASSLFVLLMSPPSLAFVPGPELVVRAGGAELEVPGYSVADVVDWNEDGRLDLLVGEGSETVIGRIRLYLNQGTRQQPVFGPWTYLQAGGVELQVDGLGCMGAFPSVVHWNGDGNKDLLVGRSDGGIVVYTNVGTNQAPVLDAGQPLTVGPPGAKVEVDTGERATPWGVDWNEDGKRDLVSGGIDGRVRVYLNVGTNAAPDLERERLAQQVGGELVVLPSHASPLTLDFDGDGRKDLLAGNLEGLVHLYLNVGTEQNPVFGERRILRVDGVPIDLAGLARTRLELVDWDGDGRDDLVSGAQDGKVRVWLGQASAPDLDGDGFSTELDCDDGDPMRHPDMPEICGDGIDNDCSVTVDDCLRLSPPVPGYAGVENTWSITGAEPGSRVLLAGARGPGGPFTVPGCPNVTVDLDDTRRLVDSAPVDAGGDAEVATIIPGSMESVTLYFQAVDRNTCQVSAMMPYRFR